MVRAKRQSGLTVPQLLNEAQRASAHQRYANVLWDLQAEDEKSTYEQLLFGLKLFLTLAEVSGLPTEVTMELLCTIHCETFQIHSPHSHPGLQKNVHGDRLLRFLATFVADANTPDRLAFAERLLGQVVKLSYAKDHGVRWRACQLVHCFMGSLPPTAELADEVAEGVERAMLERLEDAKPGVRGAAARALARLPDPGDDGMFSSCAVTEALAALLDSEKNKEVRKAVLASLPAHCSTTREQLVRRTRDEADEVRRLAYLAVAEKVALEELSVPERALLLRRGLGDRAPAVKEAAGAMVEGWLDEACEGEPLALLRELHIQQYPGEI
jgi:condensin complex subunit 3